MVVEVYTIYWVIRSIDVMKFKKCYTRESQYYIEAVYTIYFENYYRLVLFSKTDSQ